MLWYIMLYGPFLVLQAFIDPWPTTEMHQRALFAGGIVMCLWATRYFLNGANIFARIITVIGVATMILLSFLMPYMAILSLVRG